MGKTIDRIVLFIISAVGFYFFFLNTWNSIPLACSLSFICCALINHLIYRRPSRFHCSRQQAAAEILRIAYLSEEAAALHMEKLLRFKYPDEAFKVVPILKHPSGSISAGDIFSVLKKHRGNFNIAVCCTCAAAPRAFTYAKEFYSPKIAIIDQRGLARIIRESGFYKDEPKKHRPAEIARSIFRCISYRRFTVRDGLFALTLLSLYLFLGNLLYLFLSLGILFLFGISIFNNGWKTKLF